MSDITIHNIMTDGIYNDLGFRRGNRLLILVECQATWTENIIMRSLMYLMTTYQDYFRKTNQNIYKKAKVTFPKPELYVVFTGEKKEHPEYMSLSEEFFDGEECFLDVRVKVLYGSGKDDIISQYVTFAKVYDEQRKKHGKTRTAILETIRICKDKNILTEYLLEREKEVEAIMLAMYDEEEILLDYIRSEKYEAAQEAKRENAKETAIQMLKADKPFFEPQILNEIPIILIASKEQQEAEQDYYQNALGLGSEYIFAENNEEARLLVAGNRGVLIEEEFQEDQNMDFARKIPLVRYGKQMTKPYCLFWKVEKDNEKIRKFAELFKKHFL